MNEEKQLLQIIKSHASRPLFEDVGVTFADFLNLIKKERELMGPSSSPSLVILNSPSSFETHIICSWSAKLIAHLSLGHLIALKSESDAYQFLKDDFAALSDLGAGFLLKTSGSTSSPKIVYHPLENAFAAARRFHEFYGEHALTTWQLNLPLHHVGGLSLLMRSLFFGRSLVSHSNRKEIHPQAQAISLVPTQLSYFLEHSPRRLESLKLILIGGASTPLGLRERAHDLCISYSYGLTESFAAIGGTRLASSDDRAFFFPGVQAKIEDHCLCLKGPGFLHSLIKEGKIIQYQNQYYSTQDRAILNSDQSFEILGRDDQVIISGAEKIDLSEVESVVSKMSEIEAARAIGAKSNKWGEALVLFVSPYSESLNKKITEHLKNELGAHYGPKLFVDFSKLNYQGIKPSTADFQRELKDINL